MPLSLLSSVAVFVLATTHSLTRKNGETYSYFDERIRPMWDAWGHYLDHFYFVVGRNVHDSKFLLNNNCSKAEGLVPHIRSRILLPHRPQIESRDGISEYQCTMDDSDRKHIAFLHATNCTGEYFGEGPVCRCQESLRYYLKHRRLKSVSWFLFMDDDVFLRIGPLLQLLRMLDDKTRLMPAAFAIVGNSALGGGLSFSRRNSTKMCTTRSRLHVPVCQPALINRFVIIWFCPFC